MNRITFSPRRPHAKRRRQCSRRLELELLEARNLLSFTNVLVNNPAEDTVPKEDTQSETAIVLGAHSNIIAAYNDSGNFSYPTPLNPTIGGYSVSSNAGGSFTDQGELPSSGPYWANSDPVLARSNKTGTILLSMGSVNTDTVNSPTGGVGETELVYRSTNNGGTFASPIIASPGFVPGVDVADKGWMAVDNYPGPGYGNVYLAWTDYFTEKNGTQDNGGTFLTRSTDDGQTWGPSGGVPIVTKAIDGNEASHGTFVAVGPDHAVYVFYWSFGYQSGGETELMRKSTDFGQTFGPQVIVANLKTNGGNGDLGLTNSTNDKFRSNAYPQAAINPVTGDIYVVYNDNGQGNDKGDIYFTESTDGGNTWSSPVRVNDDNTRNDQWMPAIAVTPDGSHVGISWYDRRLDPADNLIDRFGEIAGISGHTVSFTPNFRITDVSFPPAFGQDPVINPTYMGDYDQATADNNYFYATWGDNRLSDAFFANQPDVRFAKIPVNGSESDAALLAASSAGGAPAASTGTAAVPLPNAGPADPARERALPPGDFLAVAAGLAWPFPGQAMTAVAAALTPAAPLPPLASLCSNTLDSNAADGAYGVPPGQGEGGGMDIAPKTTVYLDAFTVAYTINNTADVDPNIDGTYLLRSC
jgi:hypothetical protein